MKAAELEQLRAHLARFGKIRCVVCNSDEWAATGPWRAMPLPPQELSRPSVFAPSGRALFVYVSCRTCWFTMPFAWNPILKEQAEDDG